MTVSHQGPDTFFCHPHKIQSAQTLKLNRDIYWWDLHATATLHFQSPFQALETRLLLFFKCNKCETLHERGTRQRKYRWPVGRMVHKPCKEAKCCWRWLINTLSLFVACEGSVVSTASWILNHINLAVQNLTKVNRRPTLTLYSYRFFKGSTAPFDSRRQRTLPFWALAVISKYLTVNSWMLRTASWAFFCQSWSSFLSASIRLGPR